MGRQCGLLQFYQVCLYIYIGHNIYWTASVYLVGAIVLNTKILGLEQVIFGPFSGIARRAQQAEPRDFPDGRGWHVQRHRHERVAVGALRRKSPAVVKENCGRQTTERSRKKNNRLRNSPNRKINLKGIPGTIFVERKAFTTIGKVLLLQCCVYEREATRIPGITSGNAY